MKPVRRNTANDIPTGLDPEGAHPVKQERSRQLRDKALLHVRDLVREGRFTSTTMADIARAIGCSAGALYFRFRDKEALFASVVEVAMAQEAEAIAADAAGGRYAGLSLEDTVTRCVEDYLAFVQRNDRMIRALHQRSSEDPAAWGVVRLAANKMVALWIRAVAEAAGHAGDRPYMRQTGIAFQFVSSALVHSVLLDSLVRPLGTREMVFWLREMVLHFIRVEVPATLRDTPAARLPALRPVTPAPVAVLVRPRARKVAAAGPDADPQTPARPRARKVVSS
jgi:AcrR family transcriptional regulator